MLWMKSQALTLLVALIPHVLGFPHLAKFPEHHTLVGLSNEQVALVASTFSRTPGAQPLPPPISDTSAKLVNDEAHPYQPDRPGDIRGPCPGLNTLASHGYINRNGVATPAEIINAVQEGFNMGWDLASFVTYLTFIVDGNHLTNLMTIGANTTVDGELIPGFNIHGHFEGDASATRGDFYFGDHFGFNETLFDQLVEAAYLVGNGYITVESATFQRAQRINDSIARNPTFSLVSPRFFAAHAETYFPIAFFVSNQTANSTLNATIDDAWSFYSQHKFPDGFHRRQAPFELAQIVAEFPILASLIGMLPGRNEGVGNYVVDKQDLANICYVYQVQVNLTAELYPDPTPELKAAIKANLDTFYQTLQSQGCKQLFPYGH